MAKTLDKHVLIVVSLLHKTNTNTKIKTMELIKNLENLLTSYKSEVSNETLEDTNFIVEVGALTVGTDGSGVVIVENKNFPTQFTKSAVAKIITADFSDANGNKIIPTVYKRNEWYLRKIESLELTISILSK